MTNVRLKEPKNREEVLSALERAAKDFDYLIHKSDRTHKEIQLGSVKRLEVLDSTDITIANGRGPLFTSYVPTNNSYGKIGSFMIDYFSGCSDEIVDPFLSRFSEYLR